MKLIQILKAAVSACVSAITAPFVKAAEKVRASAAAVATLALCLFFTSGAHAALPEEVTDVFTDLAADGALLFAAALALWGTIRGFFAIMKLGSRFLSKAGT